MTHPDNLVQNRIVAVKRLRLVDGTLLTDQVLTLDAEGQVLSYRPLHGEVPFCEWIRDEWHLIP